MLTPDEVAVRFGDPVFINCSSFAPDALGIFWDIPFGERIVMNGSVHTWIIQEMTKWTGEARCILNRGDKICSKAPSITLFSEYKSNLKASALKLMSTAERDS